MKKIKFGIVFKLVSVLLIASMVLAGCGTKKEKSSYEDFGEIKFPLEEKVTLTYWVGLGGSVGLINDFNDMEMYKQLEEETNVHIEFIHPVSGSAAEQLNVMIASGEYPDIIENLIYNGGSSKAYEDEIILELGELQEKYAPNLTSIYEEYPELIPHVTDNEGRFFSVPGFRGGEILRIPSGLMIRQDWLDKVGLDMPETMDELTEVLRKFKTELGADVPLSATKANIKNNAFSGAFGINVTTPDAFSVENGKIVYGPADPRYKEYLTLLNTWYKEGLIEPEFSLKTRDNVSSNVLNGETGVTFGAMGRDLAGYNTSMSGKDPEFDLQPMPYPSIEKGGFNKVVSMSNVADPAAGAFITTTCKRPDIAMAWLDYAFSKKGNLAANFGTEGKTYEIVDGKPVFTENITKNPDGLTMAEAGRKSARSFAFGPFIQDVEYGNQFFGLPIQQKAAKLWGETFAKQKEDPIPRGTLTADEAAQMATLQTDITTYVDENFLKFVMGVMPLSEFDDYISTLKKMGVDDLVKIKQAAHDRFVKKNPNYVIPSDLELSRRFYE